MFVPITLNLVAFVSVVDQDVALSASKIERGLVENDYPHIQKISRNVYTDHALIGSPDDRYTTKTMFVVTDGGVMPDSAKDDYLDLYLDGRGIRSLSRGRVQNVGDYFYFASSGARHLGRN
jgi:hypothetical protein